MITAAITTTAPSHVARFLRRCAEPGLRPDDGAVLPVGRRQDEARRRREARRGLVLRLLAVFDFVVPLDKVAQPHG